MKFNTLLKGIQIFDLLLKKGAMLSMEEIASSLRMPRSTAYKYIGVMREQGLLGWDEHTGKYKLGLKFLEYGALVESQLDLKKIALPYMKELVEKTKESVILSVLTNGEAYCLETIGKESGIVYAMQRGAHLPLYSSASAKILLAFRPEKEIEAFLKRIKLFRFTSHTITDPEELRKNLREIREKGYAWSDQEVDIGARGVSAPIRSHTKEVIAGLCIVGPMQRLSNQRIKDLSKIVIKYANKISEELSAKEQ